jgi:hypothetical protein
MKMPVFVDKKTKNVIVSMKMPVFMDKKIEYWYERKD